ncbi:uncharacterized protein O3C94_014172 [Discoglossus pictus]
MSEYYEVKGDITQTIYKGCAEELPCDQVLSISTDSGLHAIINYTCCSGDKCNKAEYKMPQVDGGPNGKICPSCYAANTLNECEKERNMVCQGIDQQCVNYTGIVKAKDGTESQFSMKGCASALSCSFGFTAMLAVQEETCLNIACSE